MIWATIRDGMGWNPGYLGMSMVKSLILTSFSPKHGKRGSRSNRRDQEMETI